MAKVNITQVRSRIGATALQCRNLDALGLRRMGRTVQHEDSKIIMGMIEKVRHLVTIEMNAAPLAKKEAKKPAPKAEKATEKVAAEKKPAAPKAEKADKPVAAKKPADKKTNE
jgi:large subunit ribosomal protein L30